MSLTGSMSLTGQTLNIIDTSDDVVETFNNIKPETRNPRPRDPRFRGGLVFQAHRLCYQSTLGSRVMQKKKIRNPKPETQIGEPDGGSGGQELRQPCYPRVLPNSTVT
jgi:hypothetical protein